MGREDQGPRPEHRQGLCHHQQPLPRPGLGQRPSDQEQNHGPAAEYPPDDAAEISCPDGDRQEAGQGSARLVRGKGITKERKSRCGGKTTSSRPGNASSISDANRPNRSPINTVLPCSSTAVLRFWPTTSRFAGSLPQPRSCRSGSATP